MTGVVLDRAAIEAVIPHRYPMLLIDDVIELIPGERVVARKTVTEEDCAGHFPGNPIMPGVKMVEALAQCGAVAVLSQPENRGKLALFAGIDGVRFKRIVRPGDVLTLECQVETVRGPVGRGKARATVDGELAVRGMLTFAVGSDAASAEESSAGA
jgi:3-hydroxyacyl-[acyl-carrier-protein] dehydratase